MVLGLLGRGRHDVSAASELDADVLAASEFGGERVNGIFPMGPSLLCSYKEAAD